MDQRSAPSLLWPTLAVIVPLLILAALAWNGLRAQSRAMWEEKQGHAGRLAKDAASRLARNLEASVVEARTFPDPPVPGTPSPADAVLDGTDRQALAKLRDSPDAGLSPAGLPRRVLATLRLIELDPDTAADEVDPIIRLVTVECPSMLTELALDKLHPASEPDLVQWEQRQEMKNLLRAHPEGGWVRHDEGYGWLDAGDESVRFVHPNAVSSELAALVPREYIAHVSTDPSRFRVQSYPVVSAHAPVPFGEGLRLEIIGNAASMLAIDRVMRQQQKWAGALLAVAAAVSLGGLAMLHRSLQRERKLNEMKSQFVASVSHELRAPVASIRLMADALEAETVTAETAKEFHRLIAREGSRLSTLVGNVLDHARIEQGRRVWNMGGCHLTALVADTLRVMDPLAREKDITLASDLAELDVTCDAGAIQQALVNLLDNAIKFAPPRSTITTNLRREASRESWKLSVVDEGPGIPASEQSRIFERFYRPGDELRRETQGTGIGLSLVKAIAEAHGGSVSVLSRPGQGSTFTLTIPVSA